MLWKDRARGGPSAFFSESPRADIADPEDSHRLIGRLPLALTGAGIFARARVLSLELHAPKLISAAPKLS
jgi:hypothetical protein